MSTDDNDAYGDLDKSYLKFIYCQFLTTSEETRRKYPMENEEQNNLPTTAGTDLAVATDPAIIEVYRVSRMVGFLFCCKIYLDGEQIGRVSNGDKQRFEVAPGLHEISIKLNWSFLKSRPFSFKINNGDFIRLRSDFTFGSFATFSSWWMVKAVFSGGKVIKIEQY